MQVLIYLGAHQGSSIINQCPGFLYSGVLAQFRVEGPETMPHTGPKHFHRREIRKDRSLQLKFPLFNVITAKLFLKGKNVARPPKTAQMHLICITEHVQRLQ